MSNVFSLDALREKAAEKFGDFTIGLDESTNIVLLNPLRVPEDRRDVIADLFDSLGGKKVEEKDLDEEVEDEKGLTFFDIIKGIIKAVAADETDGEFLIDAIGEDKPLLLTVFNQWSEATQAGEA